MAKKQYDVEKMLNERARHIAKLRKADAAIREKKENSQYTQLKNNIKRLLKKGITKMARAKKVVKPTLREAKIITKRLMKQYPQMYDFPAASKAAVKHLSKGDREMILEKTVSKKLRKMYHGKK